MGEATLLIGVDCATQPSHVGAACGTLRDGQLELTHAGVADASLIERLAGWMGERDEVVVALDAPLGWPRELGRRLMGHRAGESLRAGAHALFRRATDDFVADNLGKRPLEVGADRIARTAVAALGQLEALREAARRALPVALVPGPPAQPVAIEVYPAATLLSLGLPGSGYKGPRAPAMARRAELVTALGPYMELPEELAEAMCQSDHVLDAALCVLAAAHFVEQEVYRPPDERLAAREGWIWVRPPGVRGRAS